MGPGCGSRVVEATDPPAAQTRGQREGDTCGRGARARPLPAAPAPSAGEASHCTAGGRGSQGPLPRQHSRWQPGGKGANQQRASATISAENVVVSHTVKQRLLHGAAVPPLVGVSPRCAAASPGIRHLGTLHVPAGERGRKRVFARREIAALLPYATRRNLKNVMWSKRSLTQKDAQ